MGWVGPHICSCLARVESGRMVSGTTRQGRAEEQCDSPCGCCGAPRYPKAEKMLTPDLTPLAGMVQWKRASSLVEVGTSGFLSISDLDSRVPAEMGQESQTSSCVE